MKKVRLELDQLNVESFSTTARNAPKPGTVHGQGSEWTDMETCQGDCDTVTVMGAMCECVTMGGHTCQARDAGCTVEATCAPVLYSADSCPDVCA